MFTNFRSYNKTRKHDLAWWVASQELFISFYSINLFKFPTFLLPLCVLFICNLMVVYLCFVCHPSDIAWQQPPLLSLSKVIFYFSIFPVAMFAWPLWASELKETWLPVSRSAWNSLTVYILWVGSHCRSYCTHSIGLQWCLFFLYESCLEKIGCVTIFPRFRQFLGWAGFQLREPSSGVFIFDAISPRKICYSQCDLDRLFLYLLKILVRKGTPYILFLKYFLFQIFGNDISVCVVWDVIPEQV